MGRAHHPRHRFLREDRRMPWEGRKSMRMGRCEGVHIPHMGHSEGSSRAFTRWWSDRRDRRKKHALHELFFQWLCLCSVVFSENQLTPFQTNFWGGHVTFCLFVSNLYPTGQEPCRTTNILFVAVNLTYR